jgi:carbonic anhydrase
MCEVWTTHARSMSRRRLVRLAVVGAGGAALSIAGLDLGGGVVARRHAGTPEAGLDHEVHWSYEGEEGPEHWGELDSEFATCSGGTAQSPIDIAQPTDADLTDLEFAYQTISPLHVINNGHTGQVNVPAGSSVTLDGVSYQLAQFHFHAPSEHSIAGQRPAMELHLVHMADDGTLAVVGLLLTEGEENDALMPFFQALPAMAGPEQEVTGRIDLAAVLPAMQTTYRYSGSLTTPPCSEGVHWLVFTEVGQVSAAQVEVFGKVFGANARPVQPLNDRTVEADTSA